MIKDKFPLFFTLVLLWASCSEPLPDAVLAAEAELPEQLDFNIHVKPILSDRCFACHGPDKAKIKAGLRLDQAETAYAELPESPGKRAIKPGSIRGSELVQRIVSSDPELVMPPPDSELHLSDREKAVLIRWIEQGAVYKPHWAFIPPQKPDVPETSFPDQANNPIDHFIRQKLELKDWEPAPEADREMLLRRVSLDLTGLPPTVAEMDAFLADSSPDAYELAVDRLLASPHYGERMAADWMDLSRFADTHGYTVDRYRDMSPWRDWVIRTFNENMPYDEFVTWQLAGDLLPNPTREQILATAFNRNHQQNMEGGIVEEEFRVEYVADRTNTLGKAFMGLTMECARCHDHKYDPISQKNYYELFSFFNNVREAGQISWDNATPVPTMLLSDERVDSIRAVISREIAGKKRDISDWEQAQRADFDQWLEEGRLHYSPPSVPRGLVAHFPLEDERLANLLPPYQQGQMKTQRVSTTPQMAETEKGRGLALDGDAWLDLGTIGAYERSEPFSVSIRVKVPAGLKNGVIFHKSIGAALYNWRGYHLALKDNRLELLMAHTAPYNAIIEYGPDLPRDQFVHLAVTYDGSSSAAGYRLFLNGEEVETEVENDHLYKSILFNFGGQAEAGLQIGARWRGIGIKGAVVNDVRVFDRELSPLEIRQVMTPDQFQAILQKANDQLTTADQRELQLYYLTTLADGRNQHLAALRELRKNVHSTTDTLPELMVMQEMDVTRPAFILDRGQYDAHGEPVTPNTPENILPFPDDLPPNRLGLARWLFREDHPLTARVAVNRLWQQFFGRGLVRTAEDFGNQGELPSHPELLDWLAITFRESGWDIKQMVKLIAMSATYRQSSIASPDLARDDPQNKWLARGPSRRLTAEMLRDNALAASGLLSEKIGGPSVKPYQPDGLWRINGGNYQTSPGEDRYRRSLYTFWKRTVPHPTQATFDAPARDNCTVRRQKTSTPLQALVLLNDPIYLEAARLLGQRISTEDDPESGIQSAFRLMTGRKPSDEELAVLLELRENEFRKFQEHPEKMTGWLNAGEAENDPALPQPQLAANTVVASTIINADASIIKR
ncbi:DUF1553 domain-containing protein [Flavilitoribacter nigricans]|uniref:DUF1553 domain-containing protein n=1 Tax=Flavilitoribacter nigricans (strain ATCC 23147 / DSM 23189 / NBRC 102662 / NCIMB 1420 / SS-2) TaxID=1122177 RepID=A0A2D0N0R1_FLAN2|nr:DUF1553 domain-containing protein [Flavilitoribacter nigricans]PHN01303.1 hypothetical protein CRP01_37725 [Flavilitoribacter nigricans DSM 23189 = NBRC 102662]